MFVSCIIVAAGKASRMNMHQNKQYINIGEVPVLARTISVFQHCSSINEIVVIINKDDLNTYNNLIGTSFNFPKVKKLAFGGKKRSDSVYSGLINVSEDADIVLIHDGARPFVTDNIIKSCIQGAYNHDACCVAVPVKDTIKEVDELLFVNKTVDRANLWAVQTPQAFKYDLIKKAHEKAKEESFAGTDDAILVERLGKKPFLVMGSYNNIKITTKEDIVFAQFIIEGRM